MKKQYSAGVHALLRDKATERVETEFAARNINWLNPSGSLFKACRVISCFAAAYLLVVLIITALSYSMTIEDFPNAAKVGAVIAARGWTLASIALVLLSVILVVFRRHLLPGALCLAAGTINVVVMLGELSVFTDMSMLFFRCFLPVGVLVITTVYISASVISYRVKVSRRCRKITEDIYRSRPASDTMMTESEWEEYIQNYVAQPEQKKPKKSQKHRQRKTEEQDEA